MKPILVLDNYDSFTYNLVHLLQSVADRQVVVKRNDRIDPLTWQHYERLVLSPGPGLPQEAGRMMEALSTVPPEMPILGVCLGMQALALHTGGSLYQLDHVQHGIEARIRIINENDRLKLYQDLTDPLTVGRYHSWMVNRKDLPKNWKVTAEDAEGRIMSMTHTIHPWQGVQYHPESVMTPEGKKIIQNWLQTD